MFLQKFISAVFLGLAIFSLISGEGILYAGIFGVLTFLAYPKGKTTTAETEEIDAIETFQTPQNLSGLEKAKADYANIQKSLPYIKDTDIAEQVGRLEDISKRIIKYLEAHPESVNRAKHFIYYYQEKTASLARQYISVSESGVNTAELRKLRQDMRSALKGFEVAYEKEFANIMDNEILDINAELKVARQIMESDGVKYEEPKNLPAPTVRKIEKVNNKGENKKEGGWNLKHIGLATGAVVIGAIGLFKILGGKKE